jgi:uncharacterized protein with FMN-binding domain
MGGTRIFVLQMKDLIRTAIFAALGLILIVLLVILFVSRGKTPPQTSQGLYIPGEYTSSIVLNGQPVDVRVTVTENEIVGVDLAELEEIQQVFYPLFPPAMNDLAEEVLLYQSADIVPDTDYPVTSSILRQAVVQALDQALVP